MMGESSPPGQAGPLSAGAAGTWFGHPTLATESPPESLGLFDPRLPVTHSAVMYADRFGDSLVTQTAIEFRADTFPIIAFSEHRKDIFDKDARALECQLPAPQISGSVTMYCPSSLRLRALIACSRSLQCNRAWHTRVS
jgi:hypothetical protein